MQNTAPTPRQFCTSNRSDSAAVQTSKNIKITGISFPGGGGGRENFRKTASVTDVCDENRRRPPPPPLDSL